MPVNQLGKGRLGIVADVGFHQIHVTHFWHLMIIPAEWQKWTNSSSYFLPVPAIRP
jgi:hypothetical protein